jgi:hypothetical protein
MLVFPGRRHHPPSASGHAEGEFVLDEVIFRTESCVGYSNIHHPSFHLLPDLPEFPNDALGSALSTQARATSCSAYGSDVVFSEHLTSYFEQVAVGKRQNPLIRLAQPMDFWCLIAVSRLALYCPRKIYEGRLP